jgi:hypothetical protein
MIVTGQLQRRPDHQIRLSRPQAAIRRRHLRVRLRLKHSLTPNQKVLPVVARPTVDRRVVEGDFELLPPLCPVDKGLGIQVINLDYGV